MGVQDIFPGLDPSSPHRVSMEGPIFKPFGNPIALFMEHLPKHNYFTQSWIGTFSEIQQSEMDILGAQQKGKRTFFLQTTVLQIAQRMPQDGPSATTGSDVPQIQTKDRIALWALGF